MFFKFGQPGYHINLSFVIFFALPFFIRSQDYKGLTKQEMTEVLESIRTKRGMNSISDPKFMEIVECATEGKKCIPSQRELIVNEIIIRKSYLGYGIYCPWCSVNEGQSPLRCMKMFRPFGTIGEASSEDSYESWQNEIANLEDLTENPVCDPIQNLYCLYENSQLKCNCLPGSSWDPLLNKCVVSVQSSCEFDISIYKHVYEENQPPPPDSLNIPKYYDPLSPLGEYKTEQPVIPTCTPISPGTESCSRLLNFGGPACVNQAIIDEIEKLGKYFDTVTNAVYGEKCNFTDHQNLYALHEDDKTDFHNRFERLNLLKENGNQFCDLKKFLTCSFLNKCECMLQAVYNDTEKKCILPPPYDSCGKDKDSILANMSITVEARMSIEKAFGDQMSKSCIGDNRMCYFDSSDVNNTQVYCSCPIGKSGKNCNERLTKFINHVRPAVFPNDASNDDEKVKLFDDLNKVALDFEVIFKISENDPCDPMKDIVIERADRFLRNLNKSSTVNVTKMNYINMTIEIKRLTKRHEKDFTCNRLDFPDLKCNPSKKQCYSVSAEDYWSDLAHVLRRYEVLNCGEKCVPFDLYYPAFGFIANTDELTKFWLAGNLKTCNNGKSRCGDSSDGHKAGKCICRINPEEGFENNGCDKFSSSANNSFQIIFILSLILFFD